MLVQLSIQHIALITALDIQLRPGFCVITGETGAGKSIIMDALAFALGFSARSNSHLLRHGATQGTVIATFEPAASPALSEIFQEVGISEEACLILRRTITVDGKTRAWINDTPVTVQALKRISDQLVEIHGQHEQRGLLEAATHRDILDTYGGHDPLLASVASAFGLWKRSGTALQQAESQAAEWAKERDYLEHLCHELSQARPEPGEEDRLATARTRLQQRERIIETLQAVIQEATVRHPVLPTIATIERLLRRQAVLAEHPTVIVALEELDQAATHLGGALEQLERLAEAEQEEGMSLDSVEERLFALRQLARKYDTPVDALPQLLASTESKLALLANQATELSSLQKQLAQARQTYIEAAESLHLARAQAAERLGTAIMQELAPLRMEKARFQVAVTKGDEQNWQAHGTDQVAFLVSTNPGTPFGPLIKVASGGELSRLMVAVKVVLSGLRSVGTVIFDEVDTGIGGATAAAVGQRLALLGKSMQVLVVTHQPQVAALAKTHLYVSKQTQDNDTMTHITTLTPQSQREELARMLAGHEVTDQARAAAEQLMLAGME